MDNDAYEFFNNLKKDDQTKVNFDEMFSDSKKNEALQEEKVEPSQEGDNTSVEDEDVPFHKNRKIQRYIERQAEKIMRERMSSQPVVQPESSKPVSSDVPSEWLLLYGDTPETREAWKYQSQLLEKVKHEAKQEALSELESSFQRKAAEENKFVEIITNGLEGIEDSYGIDLTSNTPAAKKERANFLELVEKISPKDEAGNVLSYADFGSTWEIYQSMKKAEQRKNDRQTEQKKEISGRSMIKPIEGTPTPTKENSKPLSWDMVSNMFGR